MGKQEWIRLCVCAFLCVFAGMLLCGGVTVQAAELPEEEQSAEELFQQFEFTELEALLEKILPEQKMTFGELVNSLVHGSLEQSGQIVGQWVKDRFFYEIQTGRQMLRQILILAVMAAVLTNFSGLVKNRHISDIGFYMLYLLMITLAISSFSTVLESASENLGVLTEFIKVLAPVYFFAVTLTSGLSASAMFYHMVIVLIYLIELVAIHFLLPVIHVQVLILVLNELSEDDYLSKFAELLGLVIQWTLKLLFSGVIGLNLVQGLLGPALDAAGRKTLLKGIEMIPGVGEIAGGVGQAALGAAVLIKNGIGVGASVICVMICLVPAMQAAVLVLLYKGAAALIQPVSDRRITDFLSGIGDGCEMVMKVILTSGILFLITIAIVAATTG